VTTFAPPGGDHLLLYDLNIIGAKPDILVLGKGKPGMMKSTPSLCEFLKQNNIELVEEKTSKAIKTFNRLFKQGKNVCAGFHLSC
jgi:hypothetical protein